MNLSFRTNVNTDSVRATSLIGLRNGQLSDLLFTAAVWGAFLTVTVVFLWLVGDVLIRGVGALSWDFVVSPVIDSGRSGGIAPVLVSTACIVAVALAVAFPLALASAILISEFLPRTGTVSRLVIVSFDVLAGMPSIVFGLFGNALFNQLLGFGYSLLSGGLTLACMVLPFMIKANIDGLRAVPRSYREAGDALAMSRASILWHVLLPAAIPGIIAGVLLGMGRALAETAALLFTSGYVTRMPESLMDSGRTISIHVYDLAMNVAGGDQMAYASALILVVLLIIINFTVVRLGDWIQRCSLRA
ncbi:MAG: phosphate ABC transporter permease PstA [Candidatus Thiodiazotropha sp. (ex Epidulcina cf. delphinae)]|nr:phosphate ABC transporter permease PstA [Candidatus Thiodiazotropha sp. (ex Epidulcina cf. delphinae)]